MKKKIIVIIIIISFVCFLAKKPTEEIRCRVIPNSNLESDILIKEEIKEIVIKFLNNQYDSNNNEFKSNIKKNLNYLKEEISIIEKDIKVEFTNHTFYNKSYNGNSIKNETHLTLLVTIKDGKGDNWWGSIYPKFLEINTTEKVEYKSFFEELIDKFGG